MLDTLAAVAIGLFILAASIGVFTSRKLVFSVISLTFAFAGSALIFAVMGQLFLALMQLFIFVGGLSTYLIVALAADEKERSLESLPAFFIIAIIVSAALALIAFRYDTAGEQLSTANFVSVIGQAISTYYLLFAMATLLLFSAAIGSIIILRRYVQLIV